MFQSINSNSNRERNNKQLLISVMLIGYVDYFNRVLATVKNSAVNAVFPIWSMVELPNLFLKYLVEYHNLKIVKSKFKSEKRRRNKHKSNVVLKGTKKDMKIDVISVTWSLNNCLLILRILTCKYYTIAL